METKTPCIYMGLQDLIPNDYRAYLIRDSRSELGLPTDSPGTVEGWYRDVVPERTACGRTSIEIENTQGRVVAAVVWTATSTASPLHIYCQGAYVDPHLRHRGLGKALCRAMMETSGCEHLEAGAVTDAGMNLMESMQREFPGKVHVWDDR